MTDPLNILASRDEFFVNSTKSVVGKATPQHVHNLQLEAILGTKTKQKG